MLNRKDIRIRDPFILTEGDVYYMYGTTYSAEDPLKATRTFSAYTSKDLENFEGPFVVFDGEQENFWGTRDYWAAEVWKYNSKFYLFGSFKSDTHHRATQILVSEFPLGPFKPLSDKLATPEEWECLDGTLWVEEGIPYMVFCHEWTQVGNGEILAIRLTEDLSGTVGEPRLLFKAGDHPFVTEISSSDMVGKVTDGPFLFKENGKLKMIWSSFCDGRYCVLEAVADRLFGDWMHFSSRFDFDGGHAMIFTAKDGKRYFSLHQPNVAPNERAVFISYEERKEN